MSMKKPSDTIGNRTLDFPAGKWFWDLKDFNASPGRKGAEVTYHEMYQHRCREQLADGMSEKPVRKSVPALPH
jgi:hypothetical protein